DAVLTAVMVEVPPFKEWLEGSRNLREGVEQGLSGFLEQIEFGDDGLLPRREVYFDFGRGELRAGRSIDAVLTAYRVAAQAACGRRRRSRSWRAPTSAGRGSPRGSPPIRWSLASGRSATRSCRIPRRPGGSPRLPTA